MTDQQLTDQPIDVPTEIAAAHRENDVVIQEALGVIDQALAQMLQRELVSTGEVADLLLDVRTLLTASGAPQS